MKLYVLRVIPFNPDIENGESSLPKEIKYFLDEKRAITYQKHYFDNSMHKEHLQYFIVIDEDEITV